MRENLKPDQKKRRVFTEHVILGNADKDRRENLLKNAARGIGKTIQKGEHLLYIVGNEDYGYVEYTILNASLPSISK